MRTVTEGARGCGYRKAGGLYLMSDGVGTACNLLPVEMTVCSCCGAGVKPARGWTWVDPDALLPHHAAVEGPPQHLLGQHPGCPLNQPGLMGEKAGLLWIGERFYKTPEDWIREGRRMGFSRRIYKVPKGFQVGETWVLAGHRKAVPAGFHGHNWQGVETTYESLMAAASDGAVADALTEVFAPGIFRIWKPERIEYVVKGDESEEELARLEARGIEPVQVVRVEQMEVPA